jgi:hypothetical protein
MARNNKLTYIVHLVGYFYNYNDRCKMYKEFYLEDQKGRNLVDFWMYTGSDCKTEF